MRYYTIIITNADDKVVKTYSSLAPNKTNSQLGATQLGALNVEFDLPLGPFAAPMSANAAYVRVWGISIQDVGAARNLNGMNIQVFGGMAKGLPLANPAQGGLLIQGTIIQAYGNWMGVNQTLDMQIVASYTASPTTNGIPLPAIGLPSSPVNIIFDCKKGTSLTAAITATLNNAFPNYKVNINISSNLVVTADNVSYHGTIAQFAIFIKALSQEIIGGAYQGVDIFLTQSSFNVYDGSAVTNPIAINFLDLVGQPTWSAPLQIQVSCVMRADIQVGYYVTLPKGQITTTAQSASNLKQGSIQTGTYFVSAVRHVGNFRNPDGQSWITTLELVQASNV